MLYESLNDWKRYHFGPVWTEVMTWVDAHAGAHETGTVFVNGCTIKTFEGQSRQRAGVQYEYHRTMVDVQIVLEGQEDLYICPAEGMQPTGVFDESADIGFFANPINTSPVRLVPGLFALLFPWDAHMPLMAVNEKPEPVLKRIIKIPLAQLQL